MSTAIKPAEFSRLTISEQLSARELLCSGGSQQTPSIQIKSPDGQVQIGLFFDNTSQKLCISSNGVIVAKFGKDNFVELPGGFKLGDSVIKSVDGVDAESVMTRAAITKYVHENIVNKQQEVIFVNRIQPQIADTPVTVDGTLRVNGSISRTYETILPRMFNLEEIVQSGVAIAADGGDILLDNSHGETNYSIANIAISCPTQQFDPDEILALKISLKHIRGREVLIALDPYGSVHLWSGMPTIEVLWDSSQKAWIRQDSVYSLPAISQANIVANIGGFEFHRIAACAKCNTIGIITTTHGDNGLAELPALFVAFTSAAKIASRPATLIEIAPAATAEMHFVLNALGNIAVVTLNEQCILFLRDGEIWQKEILSPLSAPAIALSLTDAGSQILFQTSTELILARKNAEHIWTRTTIFANPAIVLSACSGSGDIIFAITSENKIIAIFFGETTREIYAADSAINALAVSVSAETIVFAQGKSAVILDYICGGTYSVNWVIPTNAAIAKLAISADGKAIGILEVDGTFSIYSRQVLAWQRLNLQNIPGAIDFSISDCAGLIYIMSLAGVISLIH
ncbi:MAG: hypothetical protein M0R33_17265 [Methylomonas sp.]|jgi:hypothetical protein|uniref:hypothetical protein n=1 Tax=Methylomonas sp. TaxID=418 RepID=UPI0025F7053D|nr:hypothetical protein [Methylomonas sp.]MCK9608197.1 hypothetical protein [Methylomonas sp.]